MTNSGWSRLSCLLLMVACAGALTPAARAGLADPTPHLARQADGSLFWRVLRGDEHDSRYETLGGHTILEVDGLWVYATLDAAGELVPTAHIVNQTDPEIAGLPTHLARLHRPPPPIRTPPPVLRAPDRPSQAHSAPTLGRVVHLVVLAAFADDWDYSKQTVNPAYGLPQERYQALMNEPGHAFDGAQGSVADYFDEVSNGQFRVASTVTVWVRLPDRELAYANIDGQGRDDGGRLVRDALVALDATGFDFSQTDSNGDGWVDALTIIHSGWDAADGGNGAENHIWSHASIAPKVTFDGVSASRYTTIAALRGSEGDVRITRIGVACHELGHFLGIPDYYDTDGPIGGDGEGLGQWSVMASGSWLGEGARPGPFDAYTRSLLGWVTPQRIHSLPVSSGYAFNLGPSAANTASVYRVDDGFSDGEYLLLEHYGNFGKFAKFDAASGLEQGLAIWHIDERNHNNNASATPTLMRARLVEADGDQSLTTPGMGRSEPGDIWNPQTGDVWLGPEHPSKGVMRNDGGDSGVRLRIGGTPGATLALSPESPVPWLMSGADGSVGLSEAVSLRWGAATGATGYVLEEGREVPVTRYVDDAEDRDRWLEDWSARGSWQRYDHRARNVGGAADGNFSYAAVSTAWSSDEAPTLAPRLIWRDGQFVLNFRRPVYVTDATVIRWQEKRILDPGRGDYRRLQLRPWEGGAWQTVQSRSDSTSLWWSSESVGPNELAAFRGRWVELRFEVVIESWGNNIFWPHAGCVIDRFSLENVTIFVPLWTVVDVVDATFDEVDVVAPAVAGDVLYRVRATDPEGRSGAPSNLVRVNVSAAVDRVAPSRIADLRVTSSTASSIGLAFTACGDDGANGDATIEVRRSLQWPTEADFGAGESVTVPGFPAGGQAVNVTANGLPPYTTWFFAARCRDEVGNLGPISNVALGSTRNLPPLPPTLSAPAQDAVVPVNIGISWQNGMRTAEPISPTLYSVVVHLSTNRVAVEAEDPATIVLLTDALATTYVPNSNLSADLTYYWRVVNANEAGAAASPVRTFRTRGGDVTAPRAITDLRIDQVSGVSALMLWTAPGDDGAAGTASRYDLRVSREPITASNFAFAAPLPMPLPSSAGSEDGGYLVGLTPSTTYWVAVRAEDEVPNIAPLSNVVQLTTAAVETPAAASGHSPADGEVVLEGARSLVWDNGARTGEPPYRGRSQVEVFLSTSRDRVERMVRGERPDEPSAVVAEGPETMESLALGVLAAGHTWYWRVVNHNAGGATAGPVWSFRVEAADEVRPAKVSDLRVLSVTETGAEVTWTAVGDDGVSGIARAYELRLARFDFGPNGVGEVDDAEVVFGLPEPASVGVAMNLALSDLEVGTRYWAAIAATDEVGLGPWSEVVEFITTGGEAGEDVGPDADVTGGGDADDGSTSDAELDFAEPGPGDVESGHEDIESGPEDIEPGREDIEPGPEPDSRGEPGGADEGPSDVSGLDGDSDPAHAEAEAPNRPRREDGCASGGGALGGVLAGVALRIAADRRRRPSRRADCS